MLEHLAWKKFFWMLLDSPCRFAIELLSLAFYYGEQVTSILQNLPTEITFPIPTCRYDKYIPFCS